MTQTRDPGLPELVAALRSGELPLLKYLEQKEARFTNHEPFLHAFLPEAGRFERLRREAAELQARLARPESRPPLFGVAVGVKDIFHAAGFVTRAGSRVPAELLQGSEATSVTRLKDAGALILGKTVTTEFAYFAPGPTRNPHNPAHTPGGSSSGSAAAVAADLCPLALGTQTIGSVVRPASFCGVVGCKPSYGRIPMDGVLPLAPSFDHVGFFTRDVAGARLAAGILCPDWRSNLMPARKPVLGVPEGPYLARASGGMLKHFRSICGQLAEAGFELKNVSVMPDFDAIYERHFLITNAESARAHREWFPRFRAFYESTTAEKLEAGTVVSDTALAQALYARGEFARDLSEVMHRGGIDVWISPSAVGAAPEGLASTGDPVLNLPWTHARFPVVSLPSGLDGSGLPLGVQLAADLNDDERLLMWAADMEIVLRRSH